MTSSEEFFFQKWGRSIKCNKIWTQNEKYKSIS